MFLICNFLCYQRIGLVSKIKNKSRFWLRNSPFFADHGGTKDGKQWQLVTVPLPNHYFTELQDDNLIMFINRNMMRFHQKINIQVVAELRPNRTLLKNVRQEVFQYPAPDPDDDLDDLKNEVLRLFEVKYKSFRSKILEMNPEQLLMERAKLLGSQEKSSE